MNEKHRLTINLLQICDLALLALSFAIATVVTVYIDRNQSLSTFLFLRTRIINVGIIALALLTFHIIFHICGLYRSHRLSRRRTELLDVLKATTLVTASCIALTEIFSIKMINIHFLTVFWIVSTLIIGFSRVALRFIASRLHLHGRDLRYMLIVGTNNRAIEVARRIVADPQRGYQILGFVDNDWQGIEAFNKTGYKRVSDFDGLAEFLRRNVVDEVAVFLPFGSFYTYISEVGALCQQHGITMRFNPNVLGMKPAHIRSEELIGDQYIATYTSPREFWPRTAKRLLDIVVSSIALICLSPILLAAAIAIKLNSPGPVMFLQERIGLNKRRFKIFKFRTMVPNAEKLQKALEAQNEAGGPTFKIKNDPRITPVGRFLRKSSIDELPQLINVLKGDMSLVGPRPLPVRDYEGFNEDWQRRRFSVTPGITCLWQILGRSGITFEQWMLLDLQYLDEWSLWLDLKILAKTVPAVLRGAGAV